MYLLGALSRWLKRPLAYKLDSLIYRIKADHSAKRFILWLLRQLSKSVFFRPSLFLFHDKQQYVIAPTREGLSYIVSSSDLCIGRLTFEDQFSYESEMMDVVMKTLAKPCFDQLLDIGSNIGSIAMYSVCAKYASSAPAFEPDSLNYKLLSLNIQLNNLAEKITPRNVALCDQNNTTLKFAKSAQNHGDHRVGFSEQQINSFNSQEFVLVQGRTLESYRAEINTSSLLMVMDAQGSEGHILSGFPSFQNSKIPLLVEYHPNGLRNSGGFEKFVSCIMSSGNTQLIDMHAPSVILPLSKKSLIGIANSLTRDVPETDLLIF